MSTDTTTYTVSREIIRDGSRMPGEPRYLLRDGQRIAIVSSPGPAVVGTLSAAEARQRFPCSLFGGQIDYEPTGDRDGTLA